MSFFVKTIRETEKGEKVNTFFFFFFDAEVTCVVLSAKRDCVPSLPWIFGHYLSIFYLLSF